MELSGQRTKQLLPVSRDDIDISQWKDGNTPITMSSLVDGVVVEHKPYEFDKVFVSQPAPVEQITEPVLSLGEGSNGVATITKQIESLVSQ